MATPALFLNALSIVLGSFQYGHHIGELNSPQKVITTCPEAPYPDPNSLGAHVQDWVQADGSLPACIPMTNTEWSVLVATLTLGGLVGSLFVGSRLADRLGRRSALMVNNVSLSIGSLIMGCASSYMAMLLGRFLIGLGCGVVTVIVPMYLAEVSPPELRGTLGVMNQLGIVVGILFSQVLGLYFSTATGWRVILLTGAGVSLLQVLLLPFCVESPRYLALQPGGSANAKRALQILRGRQDVTKEIRDWTRQDDRAVLAEEEGHGGASPLLHESSEGLLVGGAGLGDDDESQQPKAFHALKSSRGLSVAEFVTMPRYRYPALILLLVQLSQQLSGINGVIFYSTAIMSQILPSSGAMITVYISIVNVIMTLIAAYVMDKAGRRTLLMASSTAMGASSFFLAMSLNYEIPMLSAFSIIAFVASFAIGLGPIPFLIIPEVVDTTAVASASAFALSVNWTTNFCVSVMFLKLQEWWHGNVFYMFFLLLAGLTVAINRIIPETRGKTAEEIANIYIQRNNQGSLRNSNLHKKPQSLESIDNISLFIMACPFCGGNSIEYDAGQGNATCTKCGAVLEENTIIAEVSFSESGAGAASVVGTFVGEGKAGARTSGPGRRQTSQESREKTLDAARRRIANMAVPLKLNEHHVEVAQRYFNLAITNNFIQGRRSDHVVACCLYIVCRMERTTHMLIDFSELLQLNVFKLGVTFLHLSKQLNLTLPLVDPSLYISRFANMLDFGEDTQRVANDALRLVSRMDRDWIRTGRRPAGICGACLLIAARMHHYRRSQQEIIQVVKIGESTLRRRLDEFAATSSGQLTVADFREIWLEDAADPPSFSKSRKRTHFELGEDEEAEEEINREILRRGERRHKIDLQGVKEGDEEVEEGHIETETTTGAPVMRSHNATQIAGMTQTKEVAKAENGEKENGEAEEEAEEAEEDIDEDDELLEEEMEEEMEAAMENPLIREEAARLDAEEEARKLIPFEDLDDVDDDEIESVILNEEEVKVKTQVWMELNKDYLLEQEAKRERLEKERLNGVIHTKKGRKKSKRNAPGPSATAAEAGKNILQPKLPRQKSKKINYEALETMDDLFDTKPVNYNEGSPAPVMSIFEEPGLKTPSRSRQSSIPPSREGSARPGRLSSVSRMIKNKGGSAVKFSATPTGSRTVSREQSMQARSLGSQREGSLVLADEDEDEIIAPPKSRTRAEREADATPAPEAEEQAEEEYVEEADEAPQSFTALMGYTQTEDDYYDNYNEDDWE
ncbi:transcription factor TFIIIB subunit brf1 [Mortierella sp. GBA30]|nr:transcription factor TFIIIB subunit brf1 [Mortierella sp. GBA30]